MVAIKLAKFLELLMTRDEVLIRITQLIDEFGTRPAETFSPVSEPKALYDAAYEALQQHGKPAKVADLLPALRSIARRPKLTPQLAYQALEYNRTRKNRIVRKKGLWTVKGH